MFMNSNSYVYVFLLFCMFCSVYSVSLCCSVYCLWINVYCTTASGCQPNCSQQIYQNISNHCRIISFVTSNDKIHAIIRCIMMWQTKLAVIYIYIYIYIYVCIWYVCVCVCVCIYIYIYTYTYHCKHLPTKYVLAHRDLTALRKTLQMTEIAKIKFEKFQLLLKSHCA